MPAPRSARSASGPSATTVTVSPSISAEPAAPRRAPRSRASVVRGGRRSRSSRAGSSVTQRPRSLISGRFASASSVISSASSSCAVEGELPAELQQRLQAEPGLGQLLRRRRGDRLQLQPVAEQAGRPQHLDAGAGQLLGGRAEQAVIASSSRSMRRRAGLLQRVGQRRPHRRAAPQRQQQVGLGLRAEPGQHALRLVPQAAASTIRLGSAVLRSCSTSRNAGGASVRPRRPCRPPRPSIAVATSHGSSAMAGRPRPAGPRRAPAASPSVVSASQSARSPTGVGSRAANAGEPAVRGAAR